MSNESDVQKVFAWIVDPEGGRAYPLWGQDLTFGYNPSKNDVVLDSLDADVCQAKLTWQNQQIRVQSLSTNGMTLLNGKPVGSGQQQTVAHGDSLCLGGKNFRAIRVDQMHRCKVEFQDEDGKILVSGLHSLETVVEFPQAPAKASDRAYTYSFQRWMLREGIALDSQKKCQGSCVYQAVYVKTPRQYQVSFLDALGQVYSAGSYTLEEQVSMPAGPERKPENGCSFRFIKWQYREGTALDSQGRCQGSCSYQAEYAQTAMNCQVVFYAEGGYKAGYQNNRKTLTCQVGSQVSFPSDSELNPVGGQEFDRWELASGSALEAGACTGNAEYHAVYKSSSSGHSTMIMDRYLFSFTSNRFIPISRENGLEIGATPMWKSCNPPLAPKAAFLDGQNFLLTVYSDDPILLNGQTVAKNSTVFVEDGDTLTIGGDEYTVSHPKIAKPEIKARPKQGYLENAQGYRMPLPEGETLISRRECLEFWNNSPLRQFVGKNHAVIKAENGKYFLTDCHSTNGTFCNDDRLEADKPYELHPGDVIRFAAISCRFVIE